MNTAWHKAHPMPKNPTETELKAWHKAHTAACGCREIPPSLKIVDPPLTPPNKRPRPLYSAPDCD